MALFLFCFCFWGCAKTHLYPVCFYQTAPTQQEFTAIYMPNIENAFRTTLKDKNKKIDLTLSANGRWVIANVTSSQNKRLEKVWPRLACIGDASSSSKTKEEFDCVKYIEHFIVSDQNYLEFGNARDAGGFDIWNQSPVKDTMVNCDAVHP